MSIHLSWCFELWIWDESLTWEFDISQFSYVLGPFSLKGWQKSCNRTYIYVATIATAKEFHCGQCSGGDFGRTQEATGRKVVETMQWPDLFIYYSSGFRDLGGSRWLVCSGFEFEVLILQSHIMSTLIYFDAFLVAETWWFPHHPL